MELNMKKLILLLVVSLGLASASAFGYEYQQEDRRVPYSSDRQEWLGRQINHLNRMLERVRGQVRQYRGDWRIRREVEEISSEVNHVNWRFRRGENNRFRLRREVERLHSRLHAIEDRLHVRSRDYYRWD